MKEYHPNVNWVWPSIHQTFSASNQAQHLQGGPTARWAQWGDLRWLEGVGLGWSQGETWSNSENIKNMDSLSIPPQKKHKCARPTQTNQQKNIDVPTSGPSFSIIFHHFPSFWTDIPQMYGFLTSAPRSLGSLGSLRGVPPCRGVRHRRRVATAAPGRGLQRWTPALAVLGRRRGANMAKVVPGRFFWVFLFEVVRL